MTKRVVQSPPQTPSSRSSSFSSTASRDQLLPSLKMKRSVHNTTTPNRRDLEQEGQERREGREDREEQGENRIAANQSDRDEQELSLDDLYDSSKTAKENKSTLMSYELDRMGMGRYQWCVFFLCGLGFFVDLLWAQAFGLILVPLKNEPGFNTTDYNIGLLSIAFSVGLTVGAFTWGILVDVIGRRWSFNLTCLISGVFGIASGSSPNYTALRILVAFVGVGVGGNIPIDATITMEILPTNRRFLLALLSLFQPLGVIAASGIAYGFIPSFSCGQGQAEEAVVNKSNCLKQDNMGWRYYLYVLGAITMTIFLLRFLVFSFRESPAYLINRGLDEKAIESVASIAKMNKRPGLQFDINDFHEIERRCNDRESIMTTSRNSNVSSTAVMTDYPSSSSSSSESKSSSPSSLGLLTLKDMAKQLKSAKILFQNKTMARVTALLWLTFAADYFGFTIAGVYLPQILADRGIDNNVSLSETYRDYIAIYTPGIAACILGAYMIELPKFGRQWSMVLSSTLMAVSMFVYTTVTTQAGSVGLNTLEYFMQSLFNSILYAYTPEAYPSAVRGTASGLTSTIGRIASIVAPLAAGSLYGPGGPNAATNTLYLGGGVTLLCPLALALLPYDTRGMRSY